MRGGKWLKNVWKVKFLGGVREGKWRTGLEFYKSEMKPMGCPHVRFNELNRKEGWDIEAREILGRRALLEQQDAVAQSYAKLMETYEGTTRAASRIVTQIEDCLSRGGLEPKDWDRLTSSLEKAQKIVALALDKPTSRDVVSGIPTLAISIQRENTPHAKWVNKLSPPAVDGADSVRPGEAQDSERGKEDTQDGPVLQVAGAGDAEESVPGGGVVHSPVPDAGQGDGVEADVHGRTDEPATETGGRQAE